MKKVVLWGVWLLALFGYTLAQEKLLIDQLRSEFFQLEDELWNTVLNGKFNIKDPEYEVVRRFYDFDRKIQEMPEDILRGLGPIKTIHPFLYLYSDLNIIHNLYEKFREFQTAEVFRKNREKLPSPEDIIHDILFSRHSANNTITNIYNLTFGKENMIWEVFQTLTSDDFMCKNPHQSQEQVFYNLYNTIALTGLKCYMMQQFAYLISRTYEKGNNTMEALETRKQFIQRVNDTVTIFKGSMTVSSRAIWRCDPKKHELGKTYIEITKLLQGHIQNEVDLNNWGTCTKNCAAYTSTKSYGCYDSDSAYCRSIKKCSGLIMNCRFIESHMEVCLSPNDSPRRYEYVKYDSGKTMGKKVSCRGRSVNSWHRWFVHCSYCMCICDESGLQSDRYISLRPVLAHTDENRVVTGLRLTKVKRIIHLQIQEGKLLPDGYIDNSTVQWVQVKDPFSITDKGVENGRDYFTLGHDKRTMVLDNLISSEATDIVTGVKFSIIDGNIRLQVNFSPFDFKKGKVSESNFYIHQFAKGEKINLNDVDIPTNTHNSEPNFRDNQVIKFTHTGFDVDAAQTTVPFFDIQPIYSEPAVPLSGAGLYYKGKKNYGGFIAPYITTYNFGNHMGVEFPKIPPRDDTLEELVVQEM